MILPILLTLLAQFGQQGPNLVVSPTTPQQASGAQGGPFTPAAINFSLAHQGQPFKQGPGGGSPPPLAWTAAADVNWITLSPASGSIPALQSVGVLATIDSDANALAAGQHVATITFTNTTNGVVDGTAGPKTRTITLSVSGGVLTPGTEWAGATTEPGQIGTGTAKCIARWDVVPYQTIVEATTPTFTVGVVAFHIAGIDKVSFAVEDGAFVDVEEMSLNPITGVWEYCATFELADFTADEAIELRAIAYPNAAAPPAAGTGSYPGGGFPRTLQGTDNVDPSLFLYVDVDTAQTPNVAYISWNTGDDTTGNGTEALPYKTPWKAAQLLDTNGGGDAGGGTVFMDTGDYTFATGSGGAPDAANRWITFTPKIGLTRNQVRIATFAWPGFNVAKVRLLEVKAINEIDGAGIAGLRVWLDHMTCQGAGQFTSIHGAGWTPGGWTQQFWTNVEVTDDKWSVSGFADLIRNVNCDRVQHGMILPKLTVNVTYGQMAPEPLEHNDIIAWNQRVGETIDNGIVYGYRGASLDSGGVFFKNTGALNNTALVNIMANFTSANGSIFGENCGSLNHLLLYNLTHYGWWAWSLPQASMTNVSVRGCVWGAMGINAGFGDSVNAGWFDQNHYSNISGNNITPGTNVTTGDLSTDLNSNGVAEWDFQFHPTPTSILRRMTPILPIDALNVLRPATLSAVGAFE